MNTLQPHVDPLLADPLLRVRGLAIRFGGVQAAYDVDLDVAPGEFLAIIGQNGAGKSTFLNICTGYLKPALGRVVFRGRDITGLPPRTVTRLGIARAFQYPQLFAHRTVIDNLRFAVSARGRLWQPWKALDCPAYDADAQVLLRLLQLEEVAGHRVAETSEGTRKLLDIAMALALKPLLLLMDEPTSGVSAGEKFPVMDTLTGALRERGVTAVFVEHDMDIVRRYADRVAVWAGGKILATGTPEQVFADVSALEDVL